MASIELHLLLSAKFKGEDPRKAHWGGRGGKKKKSPYKVDLSLQTTLKGPISFEGSGCCVRQATPTIILHE